MFNDLLVHGNESSFWAVFKSILMPAKTLEKQETLFYDVLVVNNECESHLSCTRLLVHIL